MLKYVNQYPQPISVCIMWYTPNCPDGGDWTKKGWWNISPGGSAVVHSADLSDVNRYWCDYIFATDGTVWDGDVTRWVPLRRFQWCEWTSSTDAVQAGFFVNDIDGNDDATFLITP
ncbi:DUF1036 domain-containing protein [Streptomyces sp. NPDC014894]|uniref:DUF1036 domain-containing protein n=1 Tax=unclassified Streptomyces TaxID=2593676 RepID=UPI0036F830F0